MAGKVATESGITGPGPYPKIVFLIIINELCERFSFYGLRTILYIFFTKYVDLSENTATTIYHAFSTVCYFTPILGAVIADGFIGLYKTIVGLSLLYCVGEIILTLTSISSLVAPNVWGPVIGLLIIAFGTGGIKPCVGAFGGNQFRPGQEKYVNNFFSLFYMSINIGSTVGTVLTPIFRNDVKCFGGDCYALAFGVPALFMLASIVIFIAGTPYYKRDDLGKNDNIIVQTLGCIYRALKNKISKGSSQKKRNHWLEYADDKYSDEMINNVKAFCKVGFVFLPLPMFWALYDQQGSRWTAQAQQLDGLIGESFTLKPDQFQAVNPIFIVALVPIEILLLEI